MMVAGHPVHEPRPLFPEAGGAQELPAVQRRSDDRQKLSAAAESVAPLPVAGSGPAIVQVSRP